MKSIVLTLERISHDYDDNQVLKVVALNFPFYIDRDKDDASIINFRSDHYEELGYFQFETEEQCNTSLNYIIEVMGNPDSWNENFIGNAPLCLNVSWDDRDLYYEREELKKKAKQAWEECESCNNDMGCEKCCLNPIYKIEYKKPITHF